MVRLANIPGKSAVKAFERAGCKELSVGTLRALIRCSGLTVEEFLTLL